jgi:hypothetical protein
VPQVDVSLVHSSVRARQADVDAPTFVKELFDWCWPDTVNEDGGDTVDDDERGFVLIETVDKLVSGAR